MVKILHIRFSSLEILHGNGIEQGYFSITHDQQYYFSAAFDHQNNLLQDDILIRIDEATIPEIISLQRWQNCMIVFNLEVEVPELRTRGVSRKKIQTRLLEIVSLDISIYEERDVMFTDKYLESISQHYLIIEDLYYANQANLTRAGNAPNYFTITTKDTHYVLPVRASHIVVKLPDTLEIASFVNNVFSGKSGVISCSSLKNGEEIQLNKSGKAGKVVLKMKWAINLHRFQIEQSLLLEANEVLLYDIELKFDNPSDVTGCKLKIMHNNKSFDYLEDIDHNKTTKIKKIAHFIIKSDSEDVDLVIHRNGKTIASARFNTSQLASYALTAIKKKWPDANNPAKFYGFIKIKGERGKNLSIPQSNSFWREALRKRQTATSMMVAIQQCSVYFANNQSLVLVSKVQNQEKIIKQLCNLNFYSDVDEPSTDSLQFAMKGDDNIYLIVKTDVKDTDFCGIGVINSGDLRLGLNVCEVGFFKNQQKAGTINCLIQKIVFWPFVKSLYQAQMNPQQQIPQHLDIFFNKITFSSYYYTYQYDNKEQVYCIVQVNKQKKVLILQNTEHDDLNFCAVAGSDQLSYTVEQPNIIKIKLTFLVSDFGHEEEIYGVAHCKVRGVDIQQKVQKLKDIEIDNDFGINLGLISLQVSKGMAPKNTPVAQGERQNKKSAAGSFDLSQASFDTQLNNKPKDNSPSRRYSGGYINSAKPKIHDFVKKNHQAMPNPPKPAVKSLKLPVIKQKKDKDKDTFGDLLMKIRKRGQGGRYEQNDIINRSENRDREMRKQDLSYDLKKIEQSNPNLNRNLQILFPKKANQKHIQMTRSKPGNDYEERLRGLKSVMNEINDIGQIQPSIRQSNEGYSARGRQNSDFSAHQQRNNEIETPIQGDDPKQQQQPNYEAEWEGNQFAEPK